MYTNAMSHREHPSHFDAWFEETYTRHTKNLTFKELRKANQSLSDIYVHKRDKSLPAGKALESEGKRAAFATVFSAFHWLMMDHLISELQLDACRLHRIMELGCGTGVCGAAWALRATSLGTPELVGMDINRWALTEAQATWKSVGLRGKTKLRSMVEFPKTEMQDAIVAGYSVNELPDGPRASLLRNLRRAHHRGATILILENVARRPVPWWDTWAESFKDLGGREDTWQFRPHLPEKLALLDKASGRDHSVLKARTLFLPTKGNQ